MSKLQLFRTLASRRMLWLGLSISIPLMLSLSGCQAKIDSARTPFAATPPPPTFSPSPPPSPTDVLDALPGDMADEIGQMEKGMPAARSGKYERPAARQRRAFAQLVSSLQTGDMAGAETVADEMRYSLIRYLDAGDENAVSFLLRETIPVPRGWGLYALREVPENHILIEAPHPVTDRRSGYVALDLYRALNARALLIAGAHRDANRNGSADVAHVSKSIFQSVHAALIEQAAIGSDPTLILQIHGFAADKHPGYPSVVLGARSEPSQGELSLSRELADSLAAHGIRAGVCEQDAWNDLCGTENVQGSTSGNALFIHVELSEAMREDDRALIAALSEVLLKR